MLLWVLPACGGDRFGYASGPGPDSLSGSVHQAGDGLNPASSVPTFMITPA
jgi:hypothetical protein